MSIQKVAAQMTMSVRGPGNRTRRLQTIAVAMKMKSRRLKSRVFLLLFLIG